ncbi:CYTH domain-containing protein [Thalassotalea mangrovi]|uniref:CYTH domain-containing protein n=1 Tax=Thalassotalea mangrovi TaxID=2572245 RepID=A0A4U1B905_9GAMM|nr:CYTH domain-containing protein [Thalassotalea mangrovi]TKB47189.1 CYTH domain-containing protein [Thalassotalea mangrovi]
MDTELELKYLICNDIEQNQLIENISALLAQPDVSVTPSQKYLSNVYFDTQDKRLRSLDIGLRIRKNQHGEAEQTIKTAGTVVAGLHQRPEYNLPVAGSFPELAEFPAHIWPDGEPVAQLQAALLPIFRTDFNRHCWMVQFADGSKVELALDIGLIVANDQQEAINEIELELVDGDAEHLFELSRLLISQLSLRPGQRSKAARGYQLAFNNDAEQAAIPSFDSSVICLNESMNIRESFVSGFSQALMLKQQLVAAYLHQPKLELIKQIADVLALSRHGLWLYQDYLPESQSERIRTQFSGVLQDLTWVESALQLQELTTASGNYRKKVEYSQNLLTELQGKLQGFPSEQEMKMYFTSADFNELQLQELQLIVTLDTRVASESGLLEFASNWLDDGLQQLQRAISMEQNMAEQQYLQSHMVLVRSLLTGYWFGQLFAAEERCEFRRPWLDMHSGIDELENLCLLRETLQQQSKLPKKLVNWLESQVDCLIQALEHCRQVALSIPPYWR